MKMSLLNVKFESNNNVCLFISMYTLMPFYICPHNATRCGMFKSYSVNEGYFEGINTNSLQIGGHWL